MANPSIICCALVLSLAACKGKKQDTTPKNTSTDAAAKIDRTLCETDDKRVVEHDLNKDTKTDVWLLYAGDVLTCKHLDFDHDGRKEWMVAYDAAGKELYRKADFDYDGKFDMLEIFDAASGQLVEVERDTDFDGKFDVREVYASGTLTGVRRDRNGDARPDQWEQYTDEQLVAITYDDDFDGKVDRRDDNPEQTKKPEPAPAPAPTPAGGSATPAGGAQQ